MPPARTSRSKWILLVGILSALVGWVVYLGGDHTAVKTTSKPEVKTIVTKPPAATQPKSNEKLIYKGVFTITAYTDGHESTGKRPGETGYGITAAGTTATQGRTISADWTILPPGTVVRIEDLEGDYVVEDKGGAIKGYRMDLFIKDLKQAKAWGVQKRKVWVVQNE